MSWNYVWVVEYGESGCAILFASVGGIGVWDECCGEERFEVEHLVQIYWNDEDVSIDMTCFLTGLLDIHWYGRLLKGCKHWKWILQLHKQVT